MRPILVQLAMIFLAAGCASPAVPSPSLVLEHPKATLAPMGTVELTATPLLVVPSTTPIRPTKTGPRSSPSAIPSITQTPTELPTGYVLVPDVVGMHYRDARGDIYGSGLIYIVKDVLDLEVPFGTILAQDPPQGTGVKLGESITIYRTFQAPGLLPGDDCHPISLTDAGGRMLFWIELDEDVDYAISTEFAYGETWLSDVLMYVYAFYQNPITNPRIFRPPQTDVYVITMGPYSISQSSLDSAGGAVSAGCLWVVPVES